MKRHGHRGGYAVVIGSDDDEVDLFKRFTDHNARLHKTQRHELIESLKLDNGNDGGYCEEAFESETKQGEVGIEYTLALVPVLAQKQSTSNRRLPTPNLPVW